MDEHTSRLVERLEETRCSTLERFRLSPADLDRRYAPGKWSIRFILHHLADAECVLYDRLRRVISEEPRGVLWAFDQDAWARGLDYGSVPLELSAAIFDAVRTGVIHQAIREYARSGEREFVHSRTGVRTLRAEFEKVAWHNEHHLGQIEVALGGGAPIQPDGDGSRLARLTDGVSA
jgi:hypothetical protein